MKQVLQIDSSIFSAQGASASLAAGFIAQLRRQHPDLKVVHRDLATAPLPHLDGERLQAIATPAEQRTAEQQAIAQQADQLIDELFAADLIVVGAPMYNFSIPSQLKAWFDHVARAGTTFRYTEKGPEGLLRGRRAVVITSRGGLHRDQPSDSETPMIRSFFGLLGIDDIEFVYAEGLNLGESARAQGLAEAGARLRELALAPALAA